MPELFWLILFVTKLTHSFISKVELSYLAFPKHSTSNFPEKGARCIDTTTVSIGQITERRKWRQL